MCICAEGFGGPDCATKLDGGQLVWETLMDSRLSAVSCGRHSPGRCHTAHLQDHPFLLHSWDHLLDPTPSLTLSRDLSLTPHISTPTPRTLLAASCTAWGTPWWRDLMPPCGCLGAWACPRGSWETCTGEDCLGEKGYLNERSPQGMLRCLSCKSPFRGVQKNIYR